MLENDSIFKSMNKLGAEKVPFFFMIDFLKQKGEVIPLHLLPNDINYAIDENNELKINRNFSFYKEPISIETYTRQFDKVYENLVYGNSYLANLTCCTPIKTDLSFYEIFKYSKAKYKLNYKNKFVCFSPETFIKIIDNKIYSYPMKGTIDASIPNAKELILTDAKESAEHATIVDLIRNDLSLISNNVYVNRYRYIEKIETNNKALLQVSTEICGDLDKNYLENLGEVFNLLLPAGSICGAPKKKTIDIILDAEEYNRNFYTGVFGIFDGENLDSSVMIRFIEEENNIKYFKSGGGITAKSNCESEYNEMIQKIYVPIY